MCIDVYLTRIVIAILNSEYLTQAGFRNNFLVRLITVNLSDTTVLPYIDFYKVCPIHGQNNPNGEALAISLA